MYINLQSLSIVHITFEKTTPQAMPNHCAMYCMLCVTCYSTVCRYYVLARSQRSPFILACLVPSAATCDVNHKIDIFVHSYCVCKYVHLYVSERLL